MNKISCNAEIHFKDFPIGTILNLVKIFSLKLILKAFLTGLNLKHIKGYALLTKLHSRTPLVCLRVE